MSNKAKKLKGREIKSMAAYYRHYFPKSKKKEIEESDIRKIAERLAAGTVKSVRRRLSA